METTINDRNREVIGRAYPRLWPQLFAIFRQACIPEDMCEDFVHDVFLKILGLDIIIEDQLQGMAVRIAYQKRTDYLRHRACMNKVHAELGWQTERSYCNTDAETHDLQRVEMSVVSRMSPTDSRIYQLARFDEKTADEIVLEVGLTKRAVESRIYRTRLIVRQTVRKAINF